MEKLFKLKENNTSVKTEILAGLTTFFAMAYIIVVNPNVLSQTGMPWGAVFLATIIASVIGTLIMGLFANIPYVLAPGLGLNAFFTFTVCFGLGFKWQEGLAMVFICGLLNILITITKVRKLLIKSIPISLQHAISGGIGIYIAYIGIKNAGLLTFTSHTGQYKMLEDGTVITDSNIVPSIINFNTPSTLLVLFGIILTVILVALKIKSAIFISIIAITLISIPFGLTTIGNSISLTDAIKELPQTIGAAFGNPGIISLFNDPSKIPLVLMTIFAFSLSDMFDTIGTFIGTSRSTNIFKEDEKSLKNSKGFKSKMDKALFSDAIATSVGAVIGTSNTTTYVESASGIGVGGRTGLTSVVISILLLLSSFFAPLVSAIPSFATAPALIIVGIMMLSSFKEINWNDICEAVPAFFAGVFMALCFSISYGIATGFIFYCITKIATKRAKEVHPIIWITTGLFILNFVILAII